MLVEIKAIASPAVTLLASQLSRIDCPKKIDLITKLTVSESIQRHRLLALEC